MDDGANLAIREWEKAFVGTTSEDRPLLEPQGEGYGQ